MNDLVERLHTTQAIIVSRATGSSDLKDQISRGYVLLKFPNTKGGTELGINLDDTHTDISNADFDNSNGLIHLEGTLNLNYTPIRCVADISLDTLDGEGFVRSLS